MGFRKDDRQLDLREFRVQVGERLGLAVIGAHTSPYRNICGFEFGKGGTDLLGKALVFDVDRDDHAALKLSVISNFRAGRVGAEVIDGTADC